MESEFIPCDLHPDKPSVHMAVVPDGRPVFQCETCKWADYMADWRNKSLIHEQGDVEKYLLGKWD